MTRRSLRVLVCAASLGVCAVAPARPATAAPLDQALARFDEVQRGIRTLSTDFTETVRSPLLKNEVVARGRVYLTKPHSVRWEYSSPEDMRFVIANDEYLGYFPERKRAERRGIRRWSEQLFRLLGLGQASDELKKFYEIRRDPTDRADDGVLVLQLDPRKKRVRKRVESVRFTIDESSGLPLRVEYRSADGNERVVQFERMVVNPELAANLYTMDIPPDVPVTEGFSALSGLTATDGP